MVFREFRTVDGRLTRNDGGGRPIWIDLLEPSPEEERQVEASLGIDVPTHEEMQEIEASSRLYEEDGALFMTVSVVHKATTDAPESSAITFILAKDTLVTLRYADPLPFQTLTRKIERSPGVGGGSAESMLMALLEQIVDRLADIMEACVADLEAISREVFGESGSRDHKDVLRRVGRVGDLATKAKDSLLSLNRMVVFLAAQMQAGKETRTRLKTLSRDVLSITEHATFVASKVTFLLDATLGLINIEQNNIIKMFSVAAVAFLPPTLIASIYGMNFQILPELGWKFGYPMALGLMVLSAVLPLLYFKRKGWL
jgi:magnesium transporter